MLFSALRRAGLVASTRGPGGGYSLGRGAHDISVADIVLAAEQGKNGQLDVDHDTMTAHQGAVTQGLWQAFNQTVLDHLGSISLADVVAGHSAAEHGANQAAEHSASGKPTSAVAPSHPRHRQATPPKRQLPRDDVPNSVFALGNAVRAR